MDVSNPCKGRPAAEKHAEMNSEQACRVQSIQQLLEFVGERSAHVKFWMEQEVDLVRNCDAEASKVRISAAAQKGRQVVHKQRNIHAVHSCCLQGCIVQSWAFAM